MRWFRGWPDFRHSLIQEGAFFGSTFLCGSFILQNFHTFGKDGCQQILFYRLIMTCDPRKGNRSPSFLIQMLRKILWTRLGFKPISKANHGGQVEWVFWYSANCTKKSQKIQLIIKLRRKNEIYYSQLRIITQQRNSQKVLRSVPSIRSWRHSHIDFQDKGSYKRMTYRYFT